MWFAYTNTFKLIENEQVQEIVENKSKQSFSSLEVIEIVEPEKTSTMPWVKKV
jgi:hypothetical protein